MSDFFKKFGNSKIPSLVLLGIFFYTGSKLISDSNEFISTSGISGSIILGIGVVWSFIFFVDYRYKEQSEHAIKQQEKAINNLSKALKSTSDTHTKIEKSNQATLTEVGEKQENSRQYSVEKGDETSVNL